MGAVAVVAIGYFGLQVLPTQLILREKFDPIEPGEVNIVGVDTKAGYYIIVANQVAQLVLGEQKGGFEAPDKEAAGSDSKLRIPLRDMLRALNGDAKSMGRFVMVLNKISDSELPVYPIVWTAEDIQKAIDGDKALERKLVADLSIELDGSPAETLRFGAVQEGIVIDSPVELRVRNGNATRTVVGRIQEEFQPRFLMDLDTRLAEKPNLSKELVRAYYIEAAQKLLKEPQNREDVRGSLKARVSSARLKQLASLPQRLLDSVSIVVNDSMMVDASYSQYQGNDEKPKYDLTINLNEEGRKRLWQYSATHIKDQLLVVWDGIAIAAPKIQQVIPFAEVQIKQISDQGLVEDTIEAIKRLNKERTSK